MSGTPRQSDNSDNDKKYKKKGTLKSIAQILANCNKTRRVDSMVLLSSEANTNSHMSRRGN